MKEYEINIGDETFVEQAGKYSVALLRAMRKFEQKLKAIRVRDKVGRYFRIGIERVK